MSVRRLSDARDISYMFIPLLYVKLWSLMWHRVERGAFTPTDLPSVVSVWNAFCSFHSVTSDPYDTDKMAVELVIQFSTTRLAMKVGQQMVFQFVDKKMLMLTVKELEGKSRGSLAWLIRGRLVNILLIKCATTENIYFRTDRSCTETDLLIIFIFSSFNHLETGCWLLTMLTSSSPLTHNVWVFEWSSRTFIGSSTTHTLTILASKRFIVNCSFGD